MIINKKAYRTLVLMLVCMLIGIFILSFIPFGKSTSSGAKVADGEKIISWTVTKTGAEENLDVTYNILNDTATEFCVGYENKEKYIEELEQESIAKEIEMDISKVPIEDLTLNEKGTIQIEKVEMDLNKLDDTQNEKDCFIISYDSLEEDLSFKIGWNSIIISSTGAQLSTSAGPNEHICTDINGILHGAWFNSQSDLQYGNSTDDGNTWISREIVDAITATYVSIICSPDGNLTISYIVSGDLKIMYSNNAGNSFNGPIVVEDDALVITSQSSAVDSNSIIHWCVMPTDSTPYYVNSSIFDNAISFYNGNATWCDLEINSTGGKIIAFSDVTFDDLNISYSADGVTWANQTVNTDLGTVGTEPSVSIAIDNSDIIQLVGIYTADLQYCNGTIGSTFTCIELDGSTSANADIVVTNKGDRYISYTNGTLCSGTISSFISNTSDGITWTNKTRLFNFGCFPSIAQSRYPTSNNISSLLKFIYTNNSAYVLFSNLTVPLPLDTTLPTSSNIQVNNSNPSILATVLFSVLWADNIGLNQTIFSWNATGVGCDTWANDSGISLTGTLNWSNFTQTIPAACVGNVNKIGWKVYTQDNSSNLGVTADTISFTGGNNCWGTSSKLIYVPAGCAYYIPSGTTGYTG